MDNACAFYPSVAMQQECLIGSYGEMNESIPKRKLTIERIAENAQIGIDEAQGILNQIIKKIVSLK